MSEPQMEAFERANSFYSMLDGSLTYYIEKCLLPDFHSETRDYPFCFDLESCPSRQEAESALLALYAETAKQLKRDVPWPFRVLKARLETGLNKHGSLVAKKIRVTVLRECI